MAVVFRLLGAALLVIGVGLLVYGLYLLVVRMAGLPAQGTTPLAAVPGNTVTLGPWLDVSFALLWSFVLMLAGLQNIGMAAFCQLMIHLEENTRASAQFLDRIRSRVESSPEGVEPWFRS
jgi:hypothetical protein